jgi:DNA-binding beta-propeller fold protein YncE
MVMSASVNELAFDEVRGRLYAVVDTRDVAIINTATGSEVGTLPGSSGSRGIAVHPAVDRVVVMNGGMRVFKNGAFVEDVGVGG